MSNKRLLTLDDLYSFYVQQGKNVSFSANDDATNLIVQLPGRAIFKKKQDDDKEGLLAVHLQANHTQTNINGSHIEDDVCENALNSFKNRPILGYLHKVNDEWNFWGHNMHEDDEGNIEYDEVPIGIIPEGCNAELKYDEDKQKKYVEIDGYIFEEYSHAAEVLQREEQCDVSVELSIRELSYNAKEKYLDIKNYFYSGVTILGCDDEGNKICPGMVGSNIVLADFSQENNSNLNDINEKLDNFFNRISNLFNNIDSKKGGQSQMTFEELLEKYGKTVEDVTFDYENLEGEALEAAFKEAFEESEGADEGESEQVAEEGESTVDENDSAEVDEPEEAEGDAPEGEEPEVNECESDEEDSDGAEFSAKEDMIKTFTISHEDIKYALYNLLAPFEESDGDYYYIENVYDDSFAYSGWCTGAIYGQKYTKDGDEVALDGERYALHRELLTDSEYAQLNDMRSNYDALKQFKSDSEEAQARSEREAVMSDEKYSLISGKIEKDGEMVFENESYAALYADMDQYSCEELSEKLKAIVGEYALSGAMNFAAIPTEKKVTNKFQLPIVENKTESRYGNLFD